MSERNEPPQDSPSGATDDGQIELSEVETSVHDHPSGGDPAQAPVGRKARTSSSRVRPMPSLAKSTDGRSLVALEPATLAPPASAADEPQDLSGDDVELLFGDSAPAVAALPTPPPDAFDLRPTDDAPRAPGVPVGRPRKAGKPRKAPVRSKSAATPGKKTAASSPPPIPKGLAPPKLKRAPGSQVAPPPEPVPSADRFDAGEDLREPTQPDIEPPTLDDVPGLDPAELFTRISSERHVAVAGLDDLTEAARSRPTPKVRSSTDPSDLIWIGDDDSDLELPGSPPQRELIPEHGFTFEESGLFLIFVDDAELPHMDEEANDDFEIEIAPVTRTISPRESAFKGFVEHINRILVRLCDTLDLVFAAKEHNELFDLDKQLNRLARVLDFVELDRQLSLIVYMQELLPLTYEPVQGRYRVGIPQRAIDYNAFANFQDNTPEFLHCLVYLFGYLVYEIPGLSRVRFEQIVLDLYGALGIMPSEPSEDAPTGPYGHADGLKLTSRTRAILAGTTAEKLTTILDALEAGMLHNQRPRYADGQGAAMTFAQTMVSYKIPDIHEKLLDISDIFGECLGAGRPNRGCLDIIREVSLRLEEILPKYNGEPIVERARTLWERVDLSERLSTGRANVGVRSHEAFARGWPQFRRSATPYIDALLGLSPTGAFEELPPVSESLQELRRLAAEYDINLLARLLDTLSERWEVAPHACGHILEDLAATIRALPIHGARFSQLESLAHTVVADIVEKRTSLTGTHRFSDEMGAHLLRLVTNADALAKEVDRVIASGEFGSVPSLGLRAQELSELAQREDSQAMALALQVIAELAGSACDDEALLTHGLERSARCLEATLNDAVETLDDVESAFQRASVELWFAWWLRPEDGINDVLLLRALRDAADDAIATIETVWTSRGSAAAFNATQLSEYQAALEGLKQLTTFWQARELNERISVHHVELVSMGGAADMQRAKVEWSTLKTSLHDALPDRPVYELDELGEELCRNLLPWSRALQARLDRGEARALANWSSEAAEVLEQIRPLAVTSMAVPLIGLTCELDNVLQQAKIVESDAPRHRLQALLYWIDRVISALVPHELLADEPSVEGAPPTSVRVPLAPVLEISTSGLEIVAKLENLQKSVKLGPIALSGKGGRESVGELRESMETLTAALTSLVPPKASQRLAQIGSRCEHRGRLLGRSIQFEHRVKRGDALTKLETEQLSVVGTMFSALETLCEGLIDAAFEGHVESSQNTKLRVEARLSKRSITVTLEHNVNALNLPVAMEALTDLGQAPPPAGAIIGALGSSPRALSRLRASSALVLADALLTPVGASLTLDDVGGWHRLEMAWNG